MASPTGKRSSESSKELIMRELDFWGAIISIIIIITFICTSIMLKRIDTKQFQVLEMMEKLHPYHIKKQNLMRKPLSEW